MVREDPVNQDLIYVGTDRGVYVSIDRGVHWQSLQSNLPNVPVHDLAIHPRERELIAATHGRSAWILDVLPLQELNAGTRHSALKLFPVEDVQASREWNRRPSEWFDESAYLPKLDGTFWAAAAGAATLTVLDDNKNAVRKITLDAKLGVNSYRWDLLMDATLAQAAETARLAKEKDKKKDKEDDQDKKDKDTPDSSSHAKTPVAEALRMRHRLYALPGEYTLKLSQGTVESSTELEIKPEEPRKPRGKAEPKLRGEHKWPRPHAELSPHPFAEELEEEAAGK